MWILTPVQPGGETHYLPSGKEYVVGRKNCDIILPGDQSISRAHAHLAATDQTLTLKDTSKYGTFVNGQQKTAPVSLESGDQVTFGVFNSKFSVAHQKAVVCSSCLDNDGKASLTQALAALGGKMVNSWTQDCTHLVMPAVKVTIKTISALLSCRPIVKPEFFSELHKAVQQKRPPPKAESFLPEIDEVSLSKENVKLEANPVRKQLFNGKTFIFLSAKQLKRLSVAVSLGGGMSQQLEEGSLPRHLLEAPHSCVVDVTSGSSQTLLPSSTTKWADSVKGIVERKGLRVITESEIGLAAIYASCDMYCNPSTPIGESESVLKVNPTIPSASLSQNVAVDETMLPAASQNITTYAVNTEPAQRTEVHDDEMATIAETPERKQNRNQNVSQSRGSKSSSQRPNTPCVVADTMRSSMNPTESLESQWKKPDSKVPGGGSRDVRRQSATHKTNGGSETLFYNKQSPQKPKSSSQVSPRQQSTLTSFFQSANKKRPLDDEFSAVVPETKRPLLQSSITPQSDSAADLFGRPPEASSSSERSRKRKEMEEEEIHLEELESLMSEDMDCFDEPSARPVRKAPPVPSSSVTQKPGFNPGEFSSSSKKQRVPKEDDTVTEQRRHVGSQYESSSKQAPRLPVTVKLEPPHPTDFTASRPESSEAPQRTSASAETSNNITPFQDDEASFVEDLELLQADTCHLKEETKTRLKPVQIKQEVQESKIDEDLPKKLVLVEFRSLTVMDPPKNKPKLVQRNAHVKDFKCFRKSRASGSSAHVIGGSDLLAHSRGKNSDLDEWLKDAVEEELLKRRDESVGDDLFRYNPTKLTKRR